MKDGVRLCDVYMYFTCFSRRKTTIYIRAFQKSRANRMDLYLYLYLSIDRLILKNGPHNYGNCQVQN